MLDRETFIVWPELHGYSSYADYIVSCDNRFCFSPTYGSKVCPLLIKLSTSKATGLHNISAKLIRECAGLICRNFQYVYKIWYISR